MPEILLPDTSSITSSTASSLLLYTDHQHQTALARRKSLPLRRLSVWLSRRTSKQGLNATDDNGYSHHHHHHHHPHTLTQGENYPDYDAQRITSDFNLHRQREHEHEQGRRNRKFTDSEAERHLAESYAAYCRAFTSAGEHLYHQKRRTWMMHGEVDLPVMTEDSAHVHAHPEEDDADGKREGLNPPDTEPSPPPHILTPSLYAEMRRVASDQKRARKRLRERRLWSWFAWIRPRESH
ncbi:hypothetical protein KXX33_002407 [Aspergillus fumigatus]|uniref:Uncharacterized protein n=2 Tax=Aspergillus fumigatus TaxID=746128 RepID=B0Y7Q3_ASPFC|nr:hypothetical protein AFUB_074610 [Aspergillus fumigatus A1163]KAH1272956.1 hypothetical protein KXX45_008612 [Aspergillus fumigatus]KAH1284775.1 hypothetical protein KXX48_001552 [Aspergillus fumigatus]KAH1307719.1 hypothetical protein KXX66_002074 [Aspergillus fumigatus]KAH1323972.1 hypothetical protein KXX38_007283 [Aspergillus fumigatus]